MLLYSMLAVCALIAGIMVYRYDLYDREPWYMLALAALLGAAAMYGAGRLQVSLLTSLGNTAAANWNVSISFLAALTEEAAKLGVVVLIALAAPRMFNDPMDGIIYGSFAGLGAALEESSAFMGWSGRLWEFLPAQEPVRILGHLVMGGIGAFAVGMMRPQRRSACPAALVATFASAVTLHFLWDLVAFSATDHGRMFAWHKAAAVTLMVGGLIMYWRLVAAGEAMSGAWFGIGGGGRRPAGSGGGGAGGAGGERAAGA